MKKLVLALVLGALALMPAQAADDAILNNMILSAAANSWNSWGGTTSVHKADVQGEAAFRIAVNKGENPWNAGVVVTVNKPVKKGDVLLAAFWARVETPPPGQQTGILSNASITSGAGENIAITGTWQMYYLSAVADADYEPGKVNIGIHLAAATQTVEFGPLFVLDFGPNYDRSKLPHNKAAAATPPAAPVGAEAIYAAELAKLRARLPVKGVLIADPGTLYPYGPDVAATTIAVPEFGGGKATHAVISKPGTHVWDDGAASPITGPIRKGDVVLVAFQIRSGDLSAGTPAGTISEFGVHGNAGSVASESGTSVKSTWTWVFASGVAAADYPPNSLGFGIQLGCCKQTLDIGPVFVLDLGPGIDLNKLPNNQGKSL